MVSTESVIIGIVVAAGIVFLFVKNNKLNTDKYRVDKARLVELQNEWRGPSELISIPPPRPVKFTGAATVLIAVIVLVLAGISASILLVALPRVERQAQREALLRRESVPTEGDITGRWTTTNKSSKSYFVAYQYEVNRFVYRSQAEVSSNVYSGLGVGSLISLRYASSHPEVSSMDDAIQRPVWLIFFSVLPFAALGLIPYLILKQKKLLEQGQPVGAIVTRVSPTRGGRSVSYQFLDFAGNTISGSAPMQAFDAPPPGAAVTAIYDPDKSRRSMLYPAQFVRLKTPSRP